MVHFLARFIVVFGVCVSLAIPVFAAEPSLSTNDIVGTYEFPLLFGGTVVFGRDGICTLTINAPPNSNKRPLVVRESYVVKGDIIYFKEIEVNGKKSNGRESRQQIISFNQDGMVLKDLSNGEEKMHKRLK